MKRSNLADQSEIVVERWFKALNKLIVQGKIQHFAGFTRDYGISRPALSRLRLERQRKFEPYYFTILVEDFGVSAHWLVTGKGGMGI